MKHTLTEWLTSRKRCRKIIDKAELIGRIWKPAVRGPDARPRARRPPRRSVEPSPQRPVSSSISTIRSRAIQKCGLRCPGSRSSAQRPGELSRGGRRCPTLPYLLAPCDLQAIKASGVTFVASLLERVIEEQARGDAAKAEGLRAVDHGHHRRQPAARPPWLGRSAAAQGRAHRARRVVAVPRGRHRSRRGDLLQGVSRCPPSARARKSASIRSRSGTTRSRKSSWQ